MKQQMSSFIITNLSLLTSLFSLQLWKYIPFRANAVSCPSYALCHSVGCYLVRLQCEHHSLDSSAKAHSIVPRIKCKLQCLAYRTLSIWPHYTFCSIFLPLLPWYYSPNFLTYFQFLLGPRFLWSAKPSAENHLCFSFTPSSFHLFWS